MFTYTENLALGKPTNQSSTVTNDNIGTAESGRAVDGNPDTEMTNRHCSHTQQNNPSWWRVDLGSDHVPVSEIYIVNRFSTRTDIQQRSKDYKITLGKYNRSVLMLVKQLVGTVCVEPRGTSGRSLSRFP